MPVDRKTGHGRENRFASQSCARAARAPFAGPDGGPKPDRGGPGTCGAEGKFSWLGSNLPDPLAEPGDSGRRTG